MTSARLSRSMCPLSHASMILFPTGPDTPAHHCCQGTSSHQEHLVPKDPYVHILPEGTHWLLVLSLLHFLFYSPHHRHHHCCCYVQWFSS